MSQNEFEQLPLFENQDNKDELRTVFQDVFQRLQNQRLQNTNREFESDILADGKQVFASFNASIEMKAEANLTFADCSDKVEPNSDNPTKEIVHKVKFIPPSYARNEGNMEEDVASIRNDTSESNDSSQMLHSVNTEQVTLMDEEQFKPSPNLLFFFGLFFSATARDAALGDAEENFKRNCKRFNRANAHAYMLCDLLQSFYPTAKTTLFEFLKLAALYNVLKKIIS